MPVTKTAKRALRSSKRKREINRSTLAKLAVAVRLAEKGATEKNIATAYSLIDRAVKSGVIHKNKAARIKSQLAKLLPKKRPVKKVLKTKTKKVKKTKSSKKK